VPQAQYIVAMTGAVTALFAATIAVGQYDIKKVLAYSTISQLGFMVAAVGMGAYVAGMFHLVTHAFFKALLFLSAGSVILGVERGHHHLAHGHHGSQEGHEEEVFDANDMRNMGGMRKTMPVTFWVYMIGTLALAGIVPFAGFWSKDEILLDASLHYQAVYWLLTIAAFFTAFYMGRQIWMVFFGEPRHEAAAHAEESPLLITVPLMILAALSLLGGALNLPFEGFHNLTHWLGHTLGEVEALDLNWGVAGISTLLALAAIALSWFIYGRNPLKAGQPDPLKRPLGFLFTGMEHKWFVDEGYWAVFVDRYVDISRFLADVIDWRFWHDWFHEKVIAGTYNWIANIGLNRYADQRGIDAFANWLASATKGISGGLRRIQNGFVRSYALSVLLGVVIILGYLLLK
jgi:NADH-quinone oxidoreductase subunit L